ncbi:MAG: hypothetical protein ACKODM_07715, partial [Cytophagales bacterium]
TTPMRAPKIPAITPKSAAPTENQMGKVKINKIITSAVDVELERVDITSIFLMRQQKVVNY